MWPSLLASLGKERFVGLCSDAGLQNGSSTHCKGCRKITWGYLGCYFARVLCAVFGCKLGSSFLVSGAAQLLIKTRLPALRCISPGCGCGVVTYEFV